ncbi:MAG: transposase, partial [Butyricicoccus sp.]|nr:transposase [Butyricicoccus sp.]
MPKSTYYFELKKNDVDEVKNADLMADIRAVFERNKQIYGVRRVYRELRNQGVFVNHKKVQRLMKKLGLAGKRPKQKYHSYKGEVGKVAANIINRDFSTTAPLQKW